MYSSPKMLRPERRPLSKNADSAQLDRELTSEGQRNEPWIGRSMNTGPADIVDVNNLSTRIDWNGLVSAGRKTSFSGVSPREYVELDEGSDSEPEDYVRLDEGSAAKVAQEMRSAHATNASQSANSLATAPSASETESLAAAMRAMLQRYPWIASETGFTTLWRADSRSPDEIRAAGFAGTNTTDHAITLHEANRTVFSSRTPDGALKFIKEIKAGGSDLDYFLYKIKAKGLRASSFQRNVDRFRDKFFQDLAGREAKRWEKPGEENSSIDFYYQVMRYQVHNTYLYVDEVHIQGPISPERIFHVEADDPDIHNAYVVRGPDTSGSPRRRRSNSI